MDQAMHTVVSERLKELNELCRRFHVGRLELFGSASRSDFNPATSDLDFVVEFREEAAHGLSGDYFGLKMALKELFGHEVDLVMAGAIRNPYFARTIAETRVTVYAG